MTVRYTVTPHRPDAHRFQVDLDVTTAGPAILRMPAWIPGSYMIREFARNVGVMTATRGGRPVTVRKLDKDTWEIGGEGPLHVSYEVYAWDLSVRAAHLDRTHGFFNATSLLLAVDGVHDVRHEVELVPPAIDGWKVATTLRRLTGDTWDFGRFYADDYDELADHPVEMGTFVHARFEACGVPHDVAITGRVRVDLHRLCRDLQAICEHQIRFFGEPAPMDRYLFLVMAVGDGYGGLEHRSSTALICKRTDLPLPGQTETTDDYRGFLGLCSHEYFHTWNVKRIKPRAFVPYDLWRENHTTLLWAFEGITSYYDDLALLRSGRIDLPGWLELLGKTATAVWRGLGRNRESLAEASFDAWTKYYRQDEDFPNAHVSYYTKGALAALCLDLEMRRLTANQKGLDDLMRALWTRRGDGSGVAEGDVEATASELVGADLGPFFDRIIRGCEELPLAELLSTMGIRMGLRAASGDKDGGGKPHKEKGPVGGDLGAKVGAAPGGARLVHVHEGGAAQRAGLSAGDVIIAVDGLQVGESSLTSRIRSYPPGTTVRVHAFRRDELFDIEVTLQPPAASTVWFEADEQAEAEVIARRAAWLGV